MGLSFAETFPMTEYPGDQHIRSESEEMKDYKSNQWFGATIKSRKEQVVACAPMYRWQYSTKNRTSGPAPTGTCRIAAQDFSSFAEYSPCRSRTTEDQVQKA
ncbi:hypothetical protein scyTo_0015903, partial [Scyliorhinus torazame]|nr:hypothetical protein [Scyliorhinus torazame]